METEIAASVVGLDLPLQEPLDRMLIALDGSPGKSRLGANAILGVSMAAARLRAQLEGKPLYESLGGPDATLLPVPCFNVLNGGAHADNPLDFQEFMIVPAGRPSFSEALRAGAEVYHALAKILAFRNLSISVGDEGGFAPRISHPVEALDLLVEAIQAAGYGPGRDVFIALDPAASAFFKGGYYVFAGQSLNAKGMTAMFGAWLKDYPILSIKDGLAEDDFAGWVHLTHELGDRLQLVGDDIFVSDPQRVREAIAMQSANAVLLKPNQIGTVTEITETAQVAKKGGFRCMMSHRSGETQDDFIADLVVALGVGQIKSGAPARGERVAKFRSTPADREGVGLPGPFRRPRCVPAWALTEAPIRWTLIQPAPGFPLENAHVPPEYPRIQGSIPGAPRGRLQWHPGRGRPDAARAVRTAQCPGQGPGYPYPDRRHLRPRAGGLPGPRGRAEDPGGENQAEAKLAYVQALGADRVVCLGNGRNDRLMLRAAALGIAVSSPEGTAVAALTAAHLFTVDAHEALALLEQPTRLIATLRD